MNPVPVTTIQFTGNDPNDAKLRRLVQDLVATQNALNALISQENAEQITEAAETAKGG